MSSIYLDLINYEPKEAFKDSSDVKYFLVVQMRSWWALKDGCKPNTSQRRLVFPSITRRSKSEIHVFRSLHTCWSLSRTRILVKPSRQVHLPALNGPISFHPPLNENCMSRTSLNPGSANARRGIRHPDVIPKRCSPRGTTAVLLRSAESSARRWLFDRASRKYFLFKMSAGFLLVFLNFDVFFLIVFFLFSSFIFFLWEHLHANERCPAEWYWHSDLNFKIAFWMSSLYLSFYIFCGAWFLVTINTNYVNRVFRLKPSKRKCSKSKRKREVSNHERTVHEST